MGRKGSIAGDSRRELQNGINTLFLIYMGAAYPLIMHDRYFDITLTKYRAFYIALCIYAVLMVLAVLVDVLGRNVSTGHGSQNSGGNVDASAGAAHGSRFIGRLRHFLDMHNIMAMDIFMAGFVLANVLAFFMSGNKAAAYLRRGGQKVRTSVRAADLSVCVYGEILQDKAVCGGHIHACGIICGNCRHMPVHGI